jgi:hypothetical protein
LKGEVGRKAIVLITDGMDFGSHYSREDAVAAAQRSDAIIYGIYYADNSAYGYGGGFSLGGASDGDLKRMAEETGGGYSPTNGARDGGFRKIEIRTSNKEYKVQARKGYFADKG